MGSMIGSIRKGTPCFIQELDGLIEPVQSAGLVGDRDNLDAPIQRLVAVFGMDAQHELGTGRRRGCDLDRVEAVDRDPQFLLFESVDCVPHIRPSRTGDAAQVDDVRSLTPQTPGFFDQRIERESRGMIDLSQDLDRIRPVAGIGPTVRARSGVASP